MITSTVAIVYHRADMDGVCSALIAACYEHIYHHNKRNEYNIESHAEDAHTIRLIGYDYTDTPDDIDNALSDIEHLAYVYMLDVTLPTSILDKYAEKIIAIDHHDKSSSIWEMYKNRFKQFHCALTHPNVYDLSNKLAKHVSACELTWMVLFPDVYMPEVVRLCGRYDVWDHDKDVLAFNEYCKSVSMTRAMHWKEVSEGIVTNGFINYPPIQDMMACMTYAIAHRYPYIQIDKSSLDAEYGDWLKNALLDGRTSLKYRSSINFQDALESSATCTIKGTDIVAIVANHTNRNSSYFDDIKNTTTHKCAVLFGYNIATASWVVNFYTINGETNMQPIFDIILANPNNKVTSHGGHMMKACGLVTNDIQEDLLQYLGFVE